MRIDYEASLKLTPVAAADPLNVVNALEDALNQYDVEAYVALFADQFDANVLGDQVTNKADLRYWPIDYGQGLGSKTRFSDCKVKENTITCKGTIHNDCSTNELPIVVTLKDGKIQKMDWPLLTDVENANHATLAILGDWATKQGVTEWSTFEGLTQSGIWSYEAGAALLAVCRKYKAAAVTPEPMSEEEKLAMSFAAAYNRRDVDTALALFVDEGLNYMWDGWKTNNKEDVRSGLEYMIGRGTELTIADCAPKGKGLGCTVSWRDDYCVKAYGQDVWRYDLTLVARDGKIRLFSAMSASADMGRYYEQWGKLRDWAETNQPDEWKKVNAPVAYDLKGQPLGELESSLCKAYLEATKK